MKQTKINGDRFSKLSTIECIREDQLSFIERSFDEQLKDIEKSYSVGIEEGYYDWGEFRHDLLVVVSAICATYEGLGIPEKSQKYIDYWNNTFAE